MRLRISTVMSKNHISNKVNDEIAVIEKVGHRVEGVDVIWVPEMGCYTAIIRYDIGELNEE